MSHLVAITYDDLAAARRVAADLGDAVKAHDVELGDLLIVERKGDGTLKLHRPSLGGGLIGLVFFVPLFGMAVGGVTGAAAGALSDSGVDDDFLRRLVQELEPGKAALIVLVRKGSADEVLTGIKERGKVFQATLSNEDEQALQAAREAARG